MEHVDEDDGGRALRHGQAVDGGLLFDSPPDDRHRRIKSGKKLPDADVADCYPAVMVSYSAGCRCSGWVGDGQRPLNVPESSGQPVWAQLSKAEGGRYY